MLENVTELEGPCLIWADTLWTQLKRMGINEFDNSHPVFGNIKEAIQTLVKQRYVPGFWLHNSSRCLLFYLLRKYLLFVSSKRISLRFVLVLVQKGLSAS